MEDFIESPCIDKCYLDESGICIGCFRSQDEINRWGHCSAEERMDILRNVSQRQKERES